jgi:hypothetical protein
MAVSTIQNASLASGVPASANMPTGSVLQVVNATTSTIASSTTTTFSDTNLTATITPKFATSKILVLVSQQGLYKTSANTSNSVSLKLLKNSTVINYFAQGYGYTNTAIENIAGCASTCYLDSPATTSATIYKTQFANFVNASTVYVQGNGDTSTMVLMEIAA